VGLTINFAEEFFIYLLTEKRVSENTFLAYKHDVLQLEAFLKSKKRSVKSCQLRHLKLLLKHFKESGLKAKTVSRKISTMKLFFDFLNERFRRSNLGKDLIFPLLEKELPAYLSEREIQSLFSVASKDNREKGIRNKVMLFLLYASGMRVSEMVSLSSDQICFDTGFVKISGKGNKDRVVPLPQNVLDLIRYYIDVVIPQLIPKPLRHLPLENNYLFFSFYGRKIKPISRQFFWMILKKLLKQASIFKKISPHSMRHSLATHLLKNGADIRSLQMLLGHENLSTVQIYTHLGDGEMRRVYDEKHPRA
jgi:integrase/recombinase XerD